MAVGITRAVRIVCVMLFAATALTTTPAFAAEATAMTHSMKLTYTRLYTGPDGVSHFADEELLLSPRGTEGFDAALAVSRIGDVQGATFASLKAGTTEDWHTAPRRQLMVCLRGIVEITAADGEKRRMTPGQFMLLEDTSGKGHITHAAGAEDHVALAVPVPETFPGKT